MYIETPGHNYCQTIDDQLLDIAFDKQLAPDVRIEAHSMPASEFERRRDLSHSEWRWFSVAQFLAEAVPTVIRS